MGPNRRPKHVSLSQISSGNADVNSDCHTYRGGVNTHKQHVVQSPHVFLIFWDPFFTTTPAAVDLMKDFVNDLLTGTYIRGLEQYGVRPGWVIGTATINMATYPAPATLSQDDLQDQLKKWLHNGDIPIARDPVEVEKVYLIFAPQASDLRSDNFCGYHAHGSYNAGSQGDNLFWAVVRGYSTAGAARQFVDSISFCVSHELAEAFTNPTGGGYYSDLTGCEIGDICEAGADGKIITVPYTKNLWKVEQNWSQADRACVLQTSWPLTWENWAGLSTPPIGIMSTALGRNEDGRLELFAVGRDAALWHTWQTAPNNGWNLPWTSLGAPASVQLDGEMLAASNQDGRLEVFAVARGQLWHIWQTTPNGSWSAWAQLPPPLSNFAVQQLGVARNLDGRLEVFVKNSVDGTIWQIWQTSPNGGWSSVWNDMGTPTHRTRTVTRPLGLLGTFGVHANADGRLELIAVATGGSMWSTSQYTPNQGWSLWRDLGSPPASLTNVISIDANDDGRLEAFFDGDGVWHTWQSMPGTWSGSWHKLGAPPPGDKGGAFATGRDLNGCIEAFAWGGDRRLWRVLQTAASNGWGAWEIVNWNDGVFDQPVLDVGTNLDGRLEVFTVGSNQAVHHIWQR